GIIVMPRERLRLASVTCLRLVVPAPAAIVLSFKSSSDAKFPLFFHARRVAATNVVTTNDTCCWRSVVLVVAPHSMSTVPLATRGIRLAPSTPREFDLQSRQILRGLDRIYDLSTEIHRIADRVLLLVKVRKRHRVTSMTDDNSIGIFDLLQCIEFLAARGHGCCHHSQCPYEPCRNRCSLHDPPPSERHV